MLEAFTHIIAQALSYEAMLWTAATVAIYFASTKLYQVSKQMALLHPMIVTTGSLIGLMLIAGVSVEEFQQSTRIISLLLGPATVALAIPLYSQIQVLMKVHWRVLLPIIFAGAFAPMISWSFLYWLDTPLNLQMSALVKSITAPLAMDTAELIGGIPSLAAVLVVSTGITGAVFGPIVFRIMNVENEAAQGVALGSVSHAIGTARAISISEQCAAFSTLALCVNGITTSVMLPLLFS